MDGLTFHHRSGLYFPRLRSGLIRRCNRAAIGMATREMPCVEYGCVRQMTDTVLGHMTRLGSSVVGLQTKANVHVRDRATMSIRGQTNG